MVAILVLLLVAAGAVGVAVSREEDAETDSETAARAGSVTGLLVGVEDDRLTLAPQGGGARQVFAVRPIDRRALDLFHLTQHAEHRWPVTVTWETENGTRYAARVDDA